MPILPTDETNQALLRKEIRDGVSCESVVSPDVIRSVASRFNLGGCCGKVAKISMGDLESIGLTPIPTVFISSFGQIIPRSGWKAMCVYVYETIEKKPFPKDYKNDPGELIAEILLKRVNND